MADKIGSHGRQEVLMEEPIFEKSEPTPEEVSASPSEAQPPRKKGNRKWLLLVLLFLAGMLTFFFVMQRRGKGSQNAPKANPPQTMLSVTTRLRSTVTTRASTVISM